MVFLLPLEVVKARALRRGKTDLARYVRRLRIPAGAHADGDPVIIRACTHERLFERFVQLLENAVFSDSFTFRARQLEDGADFRFLTGGIMEKIFCPVRSSNKD